MTDPTKRPNHLRIVKDEPPPAKPPRRQRQHQFTPDQRVRLANALRGLRMKYGTYVRVAAALGIARGTLHMVLLGKGGSHMIANRAAFLAGVPAETILYGVIYSTDRCPSCGQRLPQQP